MKTITFYSYKGGVGRTLSLVNIANQLEEFGKKVCIIDFDLEAPGIEQKYKNYIHEEIKGGLVDYIYEFAVNNNLPESIKDYTVAIKHMEGNKTLIPAGNTTKSEYWRKLSRISWWDMFYRDSSEGIPFFLDLKEKIKKEINPDYLLIDTRTGITEISSITMSLLADTIVLFAANNEENICGIEQIIRTVTRKENNLFNKQKDIHFVLTRIPLPVRPEEVSIEEEIKNQVKERVNESFEEEDQEVKSFNVIHSDRDTEISGRASICYRFNRKDDNIKSTIIPEYLSLFESLISNEISNDEREEFTNFINTKELLNSVYNNLEPNFPNLLGKLNTIDELIPKSPDSYFLRGYYNYHITKNYGKAGRTFKRGIKEDESGRCLFFYAQSLFKQKKYDEAIINFTAYINKRYSEYRVKAYRDLLISKDNLNYDTSELITEATELIEKYPYYASFYNIRSRLFLRMQSYEPALKDILKAMELHPAPLFNVTLADIKLSQGNKLEFYREMDNALKEGYDIEEILMDEDFAKQIYEQVSEDSEFIRILSRHDKKYFIELIKEKFGNREG